MSPHVVVHLLLAFESRLEDAAEDAQVTIYSQELVNLEINLAHALFAELLFAEFDVVFCCCLSFLVAHYGCR